MQGAGGAHGAALRGFSTSTVGSEESGAAAETASDAILQTQGPVARENTRTATQILRAGNDALTARRASPVMGVRGRANMGAKRPSEPTPWCLFGFFLGIQKEARRSQGGEIPLRKPLGTARRAAAPLPKKESPERAAAWGRPRKKSEPGWIYGKKTGSAGASPRPTGFF